MSNPTNPPQGSEGDGFGADTEDGEGSAPSSTDGAATGDAAGTPAAPADPNSVISQIAESIIPSFYIRYETVTLETGNIYIPVKVDNISIYNGDPDLSQKENTLNAEERQIIKGRCVGLINYLNQERVRRGEIGQNSFLIGGSSYLATARLITYYTGIYMYMSNYDPSRRDDIIAQQPIFYYLGSVIQAILESLGHDLGYDGQVATEKNALNCRYGNLKTGIRFDFNPGVSNILDEIFPSGALSTQPTTTPFIITTGTEIYNTYHIPLPIEEVDDLLLSKDAENLSVIELMKEVLLLPNRVKGFENLSLVARFDTNVSNLIRIDEGPNDDKLESTFEDIYAEQDSFDESSFNKSFVLNFGAKNSLVENINVTAKVDPNVMNAFRIPFNVGSTSLDLFEIVRTNPELSSAFQSIMSSPIYKIAVERGIVNNKIAIRRTSSYRSDDPRVPASQLSVDIDTLDEVYEQILNESIPDSEELKYFPKRDFNRFIGEVAFLSYDFQQAIINFAITQDANFNSKLLQSFLLKVDTTIHGTAGLGGFDHVVLKNYLPGVGGLYMITDINDKLTPNSFTTTLSMHLMKAIDASTVERTTPEEE